MDLSLTYLFCLSNIPICRSTFITQSLPASRACLSVSSSAIRFTTRLPIGLEPTPSHGSAIYLSRKGRMQILLSPPTFAAPARPLQQSLNINLDFRTCAAVSPIPIPIWLKMASQSNAGDDGVFGYANTNTSQSPPEIRNCFCGNVIRDGEGIYCSAGTWNIAVAACVLHIM